MKIEDIKVGMNVRRTRAMPEHERDYPKGYTFTVSEVNLNSAFILCDKGGYHNVVNLEPTDLESQLSAAQAEVERIKAAIRDRDMPKVGDVFRWGYGACGFRVFGVDGRWLAITNDKGEHLLREWDSIKGLPDFKIVSRASSTS